ncbi:MAG TPA: hypothetical protein VNX68_03455, partial [Nitrosopumilaceae archaeon]|nr:hypothetical protein [Nitrosopumilaceae archaeon]
EACQDQEGRIYLRPFIGGLVVMTNQKQFAAENDGREKAKLENAISELENEGLIESEGYERVWFKVTVKGYNYYDEKLKVEVKEG